MLSAAPLMLMPMSIQNEAAPFNAWLSYQLKRRDYNQTQFAERAGVHPSVVSAWVRGARRPGLDSAAIIADALDVDVATVLARLGADVDTGTDDERLAAITGMLRRAQLTADRYATIEAILSGWLRTDRSDQP